MTKSRDKSRDREATRRLIMNPAARSGTADVEPNWLGHTKGAAGIDQLLLDGATMDQLLEHRKNVAGVNGHLTSLASDHGLLIERGELIRFSRSHLGIPPEPAPSPPDPADGPASGDLARIVANEAEGGGYLQATEDEQERVLREIVRRRGQPEFRDRLLAAYGRRCAVSGCDATPALEAAHIDPYLGASSQHVANGLLLRADLHTLFDLDLIGIEPDTLTVALAPAIRGTAYADLHGVTLRPPKNPSAGPDRDALARRWQRFAGGGQRR